MQWFIAIPTVQEPPPPPRSTAALSVTGVGWRLWQDGHQARLEEKQCRYTVKLSFQATLFHIYCRGPAVLNINQHTESPDLYLKILPSWSKLPFAWCNIAVFLLNVLFFCEFWAPLIVSSPACVCTQVGLLIYCPLLFTCGETYSKGSKRRSRFTTVGIRAKVQNSKSWKRRKLIAHLLRRLI